MDQNQRSLVGQMKPQPTHISTCILCKRMTTIIGHAPNLEQNRFFFNHRDELNTTFQMMKLNPHLKWDGENFNCMECHYLLTKIQTTFNQFKAIQNELEELKTVVEFYQRTNSNQQQGQINSGHLSQASTSKSCVMTNNEINGIGRQYFEEFFSGGLEDIGGKPVEQPQPQQPVIYPTYPKIPGGKTNIDNTNTYQYPTSKNANNNMKQNYTAEDWAKQEYARRSSSEDQGQGQGGPGPSKPVVTKGGTTKKKGHGGRRVFICDFNSCGFESSNKQSFNNHMMKHNKDPKAICKFCNKLFNPQYIPTHLMIHTGKRPFACEFPDCQKTFKTKYMMKVHSTLHGKPKSNLKCHLCTHREFLFTHVHYLRLHYSCRHKTSDIKAP